MAAILQPPRTPSTGSPESVSVSEPVTLIDELIRQQRILTPVENFSSVHHELPSTQSRFRQLIPLTTPRPGEQYAFEVDLDRCSGCKGCVTACHSMNGLDEGETWREVGLLVGTNQNGIAIQQTVTTACHHCVEPGCLEGCPVLAYEKDPVTGIVSHLDDQCIGCSYCILKCPYEVPKFSRSRGIVRKCDMCHGRLAEGEAPACVQGCPNEAIRITTVPGNSALQQWRPETGKAQPDVWLADSPDPALTIPTTRYVSRTNSRDLKAADHDKTPIQPAHWPLVLMLALTQVGMGGVVLGGSVSMEHRPLITCTGFALFLSGLAASVIHLGRPSRAWRAWMGWRTSWLSRELIALNLFLVNASLLLLGIFSGASTLERIASIAIPWVALLATGAQMMVYRDTGRLAWNGSTTFARFLHSFLLGGLALGFGLTSNNTLAIGLIAVAVWVVWFDAFGIRLSQRRSPTVESARVDQLRTVQLRIPLLWRRGLLVLGGVVIPTVSLVLGSAPFPSLTLLAPALVVCSEILERLIFFRSAAPSRMPGLA